MSIIDDVLEILEDGRWHDVREAVKKSGLNESKAEAVLGFLAEYNFITLNKEQQKVKLTSTMLKFLEALTRKHAK